MVGWFFGIFVPSTSEPWAEVWGICGPWVASKVKTEVWEMFKEWAKSRGARSIKAIVTRSPERFYEVFYRELGFAKIGIVLEAKL